MNERDEYILQTATDRFERRMAEETGKIRVEMAGLRGDLRTEMASFRGDLRSETGALRAEMIERNHELLKWALVLFVGQLAAQAAMFALFV